MEVFFQFGVFLLLLLLGLLVGRATEKRHLESLSEREARFKHVPCTTCKTAPNEAQVQKSRLVMGSVVISVDYYKRFLATLRAIVGGEVRSYTTLIERGRREAVLRMKTKAPNADMFVNFRLETATISNGAKDRIGSIEMIAYATAIQYKQ